MSNELILQKYHILHLLMLDFTIGLSNIYNISNE